MYFTRFFSSTELVDRWRNGRWKYDVFISHAGEEKAFAHRLRETFKSVGLQAFVDQADLMGGDKADDRMLESLWEAPVGLALLSEKFLQKACPLMELRNIARHSILLPVLYNISHEDAERAFARSPQAEAAKTEEWHHFVHSVLRTTAVINLHVGQDEAPFEHLIIFSLVRLLATIAAPSVAQHSSNKAFALRFLDKVKVAAEAVSTKLKRLCLDQAEESKKWLIEIERLAEDLVNSPVYNM
jgi:hypothetical protein